MLIVVCTLQPYLIVSFIIAVDNLTFVRFGINFGFKNFKKAKIVFTPLLLSSLFQETNRFLYLVTHLGTNTLRLSDGIGFL